MKSITSVMFGLPIENGSGAMPVACFDENRRVLKVVGKEMTLAYDLAYIDAGQYDVRNGLLGLDPEFPHEPFAYFLGKSLIRTLERYAMTDTLNHLPFIAEWGRYAPVSSMNGVQAFRESLLKSIFETEAFTREELWSNELGICLVAIDRKSREGWMVYIMTSLREKRDLALRQAAESSEFSESGLLQFILCFFQDRPHVSLPSMHEALVELRTKFISLSR